MPSCKNLRLVLALGQLGLLVACKNFYAPVADYLDEYTNSAAIGSQHSSVATERDAQGIESIPSTGDVSITFPLRNPRSYEITPSLSLADASLNLVEGTDYSLQLSADRQSIRLTFSQAFLEANDGGTDLSGTISLQEVATLRSFPSWDFRLRCNTPPPAPANPRVMLSEDNEYILCFNLDLSRTVHSDLDSITINGLPYAISTVTTGSNQSLGFQDTQISTTIPGNLTAVGNLQPFTAIPGTTQVYFRSGITQSEASLNFTLTVRDERGLTRSASTSTAGDMLAPATLTGIDGTTPIGASLSLDPDANGQFRLRLSHSEPGVSIRWRLDDQAVTTVASPHELTLSGSASLEFWAVKPGYLDSDRIVVNIDCRMGKLYVHPADGSDDTGNGSLNKPYKTISRAIAQLSDPDDPENTVYLLESITENERENTVARFEFTATYPLQLTIDGSMAPSGQAGIDGSHTARCVHINANNSRVQLTLRNLSIINGSAPNPGGAGLYFESYQNGSSLNLLDCDLTDNRVVSGGSAQGAALYFTGASLSLTATRVRDNTIEPTGFVSADTRFKGAGIHARGSGSSPEVFLEGGEISGNMLILANGLFGYGAGIAVEDADLRLEGVAIADNGMSLTSGSTQAHGVGVYHTGGDLRITNTTVSGNVSEGAIQHTNGGGIHYSGSNMEIRDSSIIDNRISGTSSVRGAGVYVTRGTLSSMPTISIHTSSIDNNLGQSPALGYGGGLFAIEASLTIDGGSIAGNTARQSEAAAAEGYGGGLYLASNNAAHKPVIRLEGVNISGNTASKSETVDSWGYGGGVYIKFCSLTLDDGARLQQNIATTWGTGDGGGLYAQGQFPSPTTVHLNHAFIENNTASAGGGAGGGLGSGSGGGIYLAGFRPVELHTLEGPDTLVRISGNTAKSGSSFGMGQGGGIYMELNAQVFWRSGEISDNFGHTGSLNSSGEALFLTGGIIQKAGFHFYGGNISGINGTRTRHLLFLSPNTELHLQGKAGLEAGSIFLENNEPDWSTNPKIYAAAYLERQKVAELVLSQYNQGEEILYGDAKSSYYRFSIEPSAGNSYCINAEGKLSRIVYSEAGDYAELAAILTGRPVSNDTVVIALNGSIILPTEVLTIETGRHIRIIPEIGNPNLQAEQFSNSLFNIRTGGHLLLGNLDSAHPFLIDANRGGYRRTNSLFTMYGAGSLVLHNVRIKNCLQSNVNTAAALVLANNGGSVVLDSFVYINEQNPIENASTSGAIILDEGSVCHFASGSIRNFRITDATLGGVANVYGSSQLYLYQDVVLQGNSKATWPEASVTGNGQIHNPYGIVLD